MTPDAVDVDLYVNRRWDNRNCNTNNGEIPIEWSAELQMEADDVRDLSNQMNPQAFSSQWQDQMVNRQMMTTEQHNEMKERMKNSDDISIQRSCYPLRIRVHYYQETLFFPPDAHHYIDRNGSDNYHAYG